MVKDCVHSVSIVDVHVNNYENPKFNWYNFDGLNPIKVTTQNNLDTVNTKYDIHGLVIS